MIVDVYVIWEEAFPFLLSFLSLCRSHLLRNHDLSERQKLPLF